MSHSPDNLEIKPNGMLGLALERIAMTNSGFAKVKFAFFLVIVIWQNQYLELVIVWGNQHRMFCNWVVRSLNFRMGIHPH